MYNSIRRPTPLSSAAPLAVAVSFLLAGCGPNLFDRIGNFGSLGLFGIVVVVLDVIALIELLGSNSRSFGNKVGWALVIVFFPVLGCVLYYFFGRS